MLESGTENSLCKVRRAERRKSMDDKKCKLTLMVLGEMGVGKTSLLQRLTKGRFIAFNNGTSLNRFFKEVQGGSVQLEIFDTGGDERFRNIVKANFSKVEGALLVYDVTDPSSFLKLSAWMRDFRAANHKAVAFIAGNKNDLEGATVSQAMVQNFARKENCSEVFETSAKTGANVKEIFERLTEKVLEQKSGQKRHVRPPLQPQINGAMASEKQPANQQSPSDSKEEEESGDWCFPDLDYLNARNRNLYGDGGGDLPPVVPLPDDHVVLHVERCRTDLVRKRQSKCFRYQGEEEIEIRVDDNLRLRIYGDRVQEEGAFAQPPHHVTTPLTMTATLCARLRVLRLIGAESELIQVYRDDGMIYTLESLYK